ncbi:MAG TPA: MoxR family ATPase [Candidatus Nanoarchaeia archaeon]|nr:MoxR family ATPase [Candidatus Nanoarchaeia archaeon]
MEHKLEAWLREVTEQGVSDLDISSSLKESGYNAHEIQEALAFKKKIEKPIVKDFKDKTKTGKDDYKISDKIPQEIREAYILLSKTREEVAKSVVGQKKVVDAFMAALLCDGHVLLEGVPGLAKTLLVKTLAEASGCSSKRIQFTVDLLPSDILGITTYTPQKGFETIKGPIFANFIIADEINRSPPKTQSALIEAMQEKQVTISKQTLPLPKPFFVMANNNPLESSGVYNLPEAQVDRFLFKVVIGYPDKDEEVKIMENNATLSSFESFHVKPILSPQKILEMQKITKGVYMGDKIKEYIVKIIEKTRKKDFKLGQYLEWGGSPRASIGLFIASKALAVINGRNYVLPQDVKDVSHMVLRHRLILNYKARAEGITSDDIIDEILGIIQV